MKSIVRNTQICRGAPTFEGTRLTVFNVVTRIAQEGCEITCPDLDISIAEAAVCLRYCADLLCVSDGTRLPFCQGCRLETIPNPQIFARAEEFVATGDPSVIGLSVTAEECESDLALTWLVAAEQIAKLPPAQD